jgi:peptide/nickel transport system permease protein
LEEARQAFLEALAYENAEGKADTYLWLARVSENEREAYQFLERARLLEPGHRHLEEAAEAVSRRFAGRQEGQVDRAYPGVLTKRTGLRSGANGRLRRSRRRAAANWRRFKISWTVFAENRLAVLGLVLIGLFGILAVLHPFLMATVWRRSVYDPETGFDPMVMHPTLPSAKHLLGTDALGRDVLSMLLAATTPAFTVGIVAAVTTALIGTIVGTVCAYLGGTVDAVLMQIADAFLLLPAPLFMVVFGMRFSDIGPAPLGLVYGTIAGAGGAAIVMRSHALATVSKPFVEAARIAGGGSMHILLIHVVPHVLPLAALYMMLSVTGSVVSDAFVAFGGFTRAYLNWGTIIYSAFTYTEALGAGVQWHVLLPPSLALSAFASAFYLVARGLHGVADPRLRKS